MQKEIKESLDRLHTKLRSWYTTPPNRAAIVALREELGLLEYLITPALTGGEPSPGPTISNPICSEPGCKAGWREGLLNHASAGVDPVWYCTAHLKPLEHSHHVPGLAHPIGPKIQRAKDLKKEAEWFLAHHSCEKTR